MFGFGRYVKERFRAHLKSLFGTPEELSYSPSKLDRKVLKYISHDGGYFIELGANDGVSQSNTMLLEEKYGWRGLLIEAIPHKYFECRKTGRKQMISVLRQSWMKISRANLWN
ncbi:MAG: FkbM family methyltransferase [Rhodobacteraceae bacterium]|nr:FkbM family methyltransferase [Paracoccaceae bacterium]